MTWQHWLIYIHLVEPASRKPKPTCMRKMRMAMMMRKNLSVFSSSMASLVSRSERLLLLLLAL
jgi:hypothetical protein